MTLRYSLDTNIVSDLIRRPRGTVRNRLHEIGLQTVCVSTVVAGELRFGALNGGSNERRARVDAVLNLLAVAPVQPFAASAYGAIRDQLQRQGTPIGANDLWIAAHALAEGLVLVTDDEAEFSRVGGLEIENWLR